MVGVWQPWYTTGVFKVAVRVQSGNALSERELMLVRSVVDRCSRDLRSGPYKVITDGARKKVLEAIQDELRKCCEGSGMQAMTVTAITKVEGP